MGYNLSSGFSTNITLFFREDTRELNKAMIPESLLKALKWYVVVLSAIIGTSAFMIASDLHSFKPVMFGVLGYGVVYVMSYFWREFRDKVLLISVVIFICLTYLSKFMPMLIFLLTGADILSYFSEYFIWGATMGVVGIPIMVLVFKKL